MKACDAWVTFRPQVPTSNLPSGPFDCNVFHLLILPVRRLCCARDTRNTYVLGANACCNPLEQELHCSF